MWIVALLACGETVETVAPAPAHEHGHDHEAAAPKTPTSGLVLELDGGKMWMLDESTREKMTEIRALTAKPPAATVEEAHGLAKELDTVLSGLIQGCVMKGPSHDQLHHFLEAFFPALALLKSAKSIEDAHAALHTLRSHVAVFDKHFE